LVAWLVKVGDPVKRGQNLMEVLTDKATMEVPSPFAGTISGLQAEPGSRIKVGETVLTYTPAGQKEAEPVNSEVQAEKAEKPAASRAQPVSNRSPARVALPDGNSSVRAAPSVRYLARKLGVDLSHVHGSGPGGRILVGDLSSYVKPAGAETKPAAVQPRPDYGAPGTRIKLQGVRRKIADHMVLAKR